MFRKTWQLEKAAEALDMAHRLGVLLDIRPYRRILTDCVELNRFKLAERVMTLQIERDIPADLKYYLLCLQYYSQRDGHWGADQYSGVIFNHLLKKRGAITIKSASQILRVLRRLCSVSVTLHFWELATTKLSLPLNGETYVEVLSALTFQGDRYEASKLAHLAVRFSKLVTLSSTTSETFDHSCLKRKQGKSS